MSFETAFSSTGGHLRRAGPPAPLVMARRCAGCQWPVPCGVLRYGAWLWGVFGLACGRAASRPDGAGVSDATGENKPGQKRRAGCRLPPLWPTAGVRPRAANPGDGTSPGSWPRLWHITGVGPGRVTPAMCHHRGNTRTRPPEPGTPATKAHGPPRGPARGRTAYTGPAATTITARSQSATACLARLWHMAGVQRPRQTR